MPKEPRPMGLWRIPLSMEVMGKLHATSAPTLDMLKKAAPSESQVTKREAQGEPIVPVEELAEEAAEEGEVGQAVFRKYDNRAYVPGHWIKGHLKECGDNLSRTLNFWGLKDFVGRTLFVTPKRCFLDGLEVKSETWPTYFDIPRIGRRSGFRTAEYVDDPRLEWTLWLVNDPRWTEHLLRELLTYGCMHGIGGGRGMDEGKYIYTMPELDQKKMLMERDAGWQQYLRELMEISHSQQG